MFETILFVIVIIMFLLFVIGIPLLMIFNGKTFKKIGRRGKPVTAEVVDIEITKTYDEEGNVTSVFKKIICKFTFEGEVHEQQLLAGIEKVKKGDKIECIYDKKKNVLTTEDAARQAVKFGRLWIFILIFFIFFIPISIFTEIILGLISESLHIKLNQLLGLGSCGIFIAVSWYFIKQSRIPKNGIKVKGKIIEVYKEWQPYSDGGVGYDTFAPVYEYEYKGEKCTHLSTIFSKKNIYKIGTETDLYISPKTEKVIEITESKNTEKLCWSIIIFCIIVIILSILDMFNVFPLG